MNKKLLLVSGCPRSGTTLMNIVLNTHPEVAITNEINLYSIINNMDNIFFRREKKIKKMIFLEKEIQREKTIRETWNANELLEWIPKKNQCKKNIIYNLCSSIKNSKINIYGDKTPTYYRNDLSLLANDLNQDIFVIHISRDPFEVISSIERRIKNSKKNKDYWKSILDLKSAINEWIFAWNSRKNLSKFNRVNLLDLNYNAFIKNPKYGVEIISNFLNIRNKFDISMVNNYELNHSITKNNIIKIAPQLKEIMNIWGKFEIILNRYDEIELLKDNIYTIFKKKLISKLKYFKNLGTSNYKND